MVRSKDHMQYAAPAPAGPEPDPVEPTIEQVLRARVAREIDARLAVERQWANASREVARLRRQLRDAQLNLASERSQAEKLARDAVNLADVLTLLTRRYAEELTHRRACEEAVRRAEADAGEGIDVETA